MNEEKRERKPPVPKLFECKQEQEPVCLDAPVCEEKFDPRSTCRNILAHPKKVCKKSICRKFLKTDEERTFGDVICIPRPPCKIKRHFGPVSSKEGLEEDSDELFFRMYGSQLGLVLNEGTVSETDVLRGRFGGRDSKYVSRDGRLGGRDGGFSGEGTGAVWTKYGIVQDEETAKLLEELSKYLDAEGMAAISALGGAEICPCCKCTLCRCKLRGVTSEMLLAARKRALLEQRLKDWGKAGYTWSFDYFYKPDLEYYEKERQSRLERERSLAAEEEEAILIEEMLKEEALYGEQIYDEQGEEIPRGREGSVRYTTSVQARPSIAEEAEQAEMEAIEEALKQEDFVEGGDVEEDEWIKYKVSEWGGAPHQGAPSIVESIKRRVSIASSTPSQKARTEESLQERYSRKSARSSIESWVETRQDLFGVLPYTTLDASKEPLDIKFPKADIKAPVRLIPQEEEEEEGEELERSSSSIESSIRWKDEGWVGEMKHVKRSKRKSRGKSLSIKDSKESSVKSAPRGTALRRPSVESRISKAVSIRAPGDEDEEYERASVISGASRRLSRKSVDTTRASISARAKAEERRKSMTPSLRLYTDICDCLPGFCTCADKHYVFQKEDFGAGFKPITDEKSTQAQEEEGADDDLSAKSSCICYHPWDDIDDDLLKITPVASMTLDYPAKPDVPEKKFICEKQPIFQKTVVIVKPEAMRFKDVILRAIKKEGLDIVDERLLVLTPEQVAEIYSENYGSAYFPMFVQRISSTPILVLSVAGIYAVDRWKYLIGQGEVIPDSWFYPESIKRRFGIHNDVYGAMRTSSDFSTAKKELRYFFPLDIIEPILIDSEEVQDYCDKHIHPTLLKALYKLAREKPEDPLMFLADYLLKNNPYQPHYPDPHIALAPI